MDPRVTKFFTIAIAAFIPWLIVLAFLGAAMDFPRLVFIFTHYTLDIALFSIAFGIYFRGHPNENPFTVMLIAMVSLAFYEYLFFMYFYDGTFWFLNYIDWILPSFIVASTIYFTGRLLR